MQDSDDLEHDQEDATCQGARCVFSTLARLRMASVFEEHHGQNTHDDFVSALIGAPA